ncbi:5'-nucleotidase C-terminal domain-containing protein [Cytobacillus sp. FJAT-53684]|uniref:5'-nucleotidase C-terminal domain-containing protein n=1 Tax=Cytobacillus mangrovibacter TaxID=3299024 RepID=A0ABW6JX52_9BACI
MGYKSDRYKRFVATAAAAALVVSAVAPVSASTSDATGEYKAAVEYVKSAGIANGLENSLSKVNDPIKRGDVAVMVANALRLDVQNAPSTKFTDLNARVKGSVNALFAKGIINGKTASSFAPDDYITRAELAKVLTIAFGLKAGTVKNGFTDVSSPWDPYVDALLNSGLTKGVSATKFGSSLKATTGQVALFIYRSKHLLDTEAPVLKFEGQKTIYVSYGASYNLPTVTATDNYDPAVKVTTVIKDASGKTIDKLDTKNPGTYTVTYSAVDLAGNRAADVVLTVIVSSPSTTSPPVVNPDPPEKDNFTLSLMHTNDTHAHLDNVAKRITAIKEVRAKKPDAVLVDAGDVFSGTLYFNEYKGQADLAFMNLAGYDVMTLGNHEFDLGGSPEGHEALADFIKGAKFPIVSSNVDFSKDANLKDLFVPGLSSNPEGGKIYNSLIKTVDGEKIGFIGLTTEETSSIASPEAVEFKYYIDSAQNAVDSLEKQGVNKIVAVTHIGFDDNVQVDNDLELAKLVDGIDVIVGGHSHTRLDAAVEVTKDEEGKEKDPTIIVQAYQYGDFLGALDVEFDAKGKVVAKTGQLIDVSKKADDEEAAELLKEYSSKIDDLKNTQTGATATEAYPNPRLTDEGNVEGVSVRATETALGNLIADGMLAKAKEKDPRTVIAMQNGGGIRAALDKGPITLGDILTILPFGNTLATMELSGAEIKAALEHSVSQAPKESGGFLHVSGMKFTFDSTKPVGERIVSMEVNVGGDYVAIEENAKYVVATNAFTAKGGDGFNVFKAAYEASRVTDWGYSDWETFRDYVKAEKEVTPTIEGRIKDVTKEAPVVTDDNFSGTPDKPAVYTGDVTINVDSVAKLENATVNGNLTITGDVANLSFTNVTVHGDLNLTDFNGNVNLNGIVVDGETIF